MDIGLAETKNKKLIYKGICSSCGFNKNRLLPKSEGKGLFNTMFNTVPEKHLKHATGEQVPNGSYNDRKTYSYAGPFTNLDKRMDDGVLMIWTRPLGNTM